MGLETAPLRTRVRVARTGARALHAQGKAHVFTSERARAAAAARWGGKGYKYATEEREIAEDGPEQHQDRDGSG